ncbi:RagB/SusD family nutrient uptake outer membrane protein [Pedobacter heparinus]|uniref:RagB/SusD family nutrient uptake outer membrane protein n=1 Tax=Pedobacter heparinus TaxID=984 RepID=UPI002930C8EF|nr:RagB/SusD family nutrient uptake outer membrane protein [Pedobacter heparinus]
MEKYYMEFRKYALLYLVVITTCLIACKKNWLEVKSDKKLTVPISLNDFQGLLDNVSAMNQQFPNLGEVASDGHYVTDISYQNTTKNATSDGYVWSKTVLHNTVTDWNTSYSKILIDNIVLDGLNKLTLTDNADKEQWSNIKGQALFHRARIFFELAQIYSPPYNSSTADRDIGIVLRLSSDIKSVSKRSTVKDTYEQILKDLNEAKNLLPIRPLVLTRGSSSAVDALLARAYLSMEDYDNSFKAADNCLKQYSSLLDYNEVLASANFIGRYNKEVLFHTNFVASFITTNCLVDRNLFDAYLSNDLRKTRFYRQNANNTISFKGAYESLTNQQFNGLSTDEIYLTRSECYARAGKTAEAMKDLNDLMIKRWDKNVPYPTITATSADDALVKILEERKKELILRGVRWMDLRRLNKDPRYAVTLKRTVLGVEYTLEPNSYRYTFPIPDDIIQQTGIQQNPGWP